jgi:hypothetical protein
MRVADRAEAGVLAGGAEGELVQVRPADQHRTGGAQPGDERSVRARPSIVERTRSRGVRHAGLINQVLERDRNAVERTAITAGGQLAVGRVGGLTRGGFVDEREGVRGLAVPGNRGETGFGQLARRRLAAAQPRRRIGNGRRGERLHGAPRPSGGESRPRARIQAESSSGQACSTGWFRASPTPCGPGSKMCSSAGTPARRRAR